MFLGPRGNSEVVSFSQVVEVPWEVPLRVSFDRLLSPVGYSGVEVETRDDVDEVFTIPKRRVRPKKVKSGPINAPVEIEEEVVKGHCPQLDLMGTPPRPRGRPKKNHKDSRGSKVASYRHRGRPKKSKRGRQGLSFTCRESHLSVEVEGPYEVAASPATPLVPPSSSVVDFHPPFWELFHSS